MANERLILAIGQMERALNRLEAANARIDRSTKGAPDGPGQDLLNRHDQLKAAVRDTLADIDALMAGQG